MNPGEKLKKKDVKNDLSNFMSVFPTISSQCNVDCVWSLGLLGFCDSVGQFLGAYKHPNKQSCIWLREKLILKVHICGIFLWYGKTKLIFKRTLDWYNII